MAPSASSPLTASPSSLILSHSWRSSLVVLAMFLLLLSHSSVDAAVVMSLDPPGVERSFHVDLFRWVYFRFDVHRGKQWRLTMTHSVAADLDIYVREGTELPQRSPGHFGWKNTDTSPTIVLQSNKTSTASTAFTVGVFNFKGPNTPFTLLFEELDPCEAMCVHGTCRSGHCVCEKDWGSDSCDVRVQEVQLNKETSFHFDGQVSLQYFKISEPRKNLIMRVRQSTNPGSVADTTIFARKGSPPTRSAYDLDFLHQTQVRFNLTFTAAGDDWYFGVVGNRYTAVAIMMREVAPKNCLNLCSFHGECINGKCKCRSDYSGDLCETMDRELRTNEVAGGLVSPGSWNYYKYKSESMNPFLIEVDHDDGRDLAIYVNPSSPPTLSQYSLVVDDRSPKMTGLVSTPLFKTWYIGILGSTEAAYTLKVSVSEHQDQCLETCVHGTCSEGSCVCTHPYLGVTCNSTAVELPNSELVLGSVTTNSWSYFSVDVKDSSSTMVVLHEKETEGQIWMYANREVIPTTQTYITADTSVYSPTHRVAVQYPNPTVDSKLIIGVYGTITLDPSKVFHFHISAFHSPFKKRVAIGDVETKNRD